ncbi:hypothetical protein Pmar_PMAR015080 [Perkinsus marinus ATCC 50983]|uniref:Uncharacterized protein n=1 Tax=Perkinsus marinus (strain ATCC 50983 / TXsc) TaxID=423536 RepID=C5KWG4_PERM5|nr:hypothetical protein Pmar_PMAR015080 [Perkinsus marinus ATCC 50983]EER11159.1 hypothetical protein Pmar_PMAR015080 [Perkinsus marinus ATCC 50983]|eukprot:XP_002779364.1 hypothetical protein Pmar_PMAR015080 [Perkinsus marinus ATCC 50983]
MLYINRKKIVHNGIPPCFTFIFGGIQPKLSKAAANRLVVDDDGFMYLITTYYGVRGPKRARPVLPLRKPNDETAPHLKACPVRQDPSNSILVPTRGYGTLKLMDVPDAFFRIQTGSNL